MQIMVYPLLKPVMVPLIGFYIKKIEGKENIPKDCGFIVAANHASYLDDFAVPVAIVPTIDKKIHFYVNSRYYRNWLLKKFLNHAECIPISSSKAAGSKRINKIGLKKAIYYLKKKEPIGIFPEGSRSHDGKLKAAKTGIACLLLKARVPVLPVGIMGSYGVLPKGAVFPRHKKCSIRIGKLMYFDKYYKARQNKRVLKEVTNKIMETIARLSGQKYVH